MNTPSAINKKNLQELSIGFKPDNVKFSLALNNSYSIESVIDNANIAIKRLEQYVNNGCSDEGLNFKYKQIINY